MKVSEHELEKVLQNAPVPRGPAGLEERLMREIRLPASGGLPHHRAVRPGPRLGGWRRWMPLLLPALAAAGLTSAVVVQRAQMAELREEVQQWRAEAGRVASTVGAGSPIRSGLDLPDERAEILRLRERGDQLTVELAAAESVLVENASLRREIAGLEDRIGEEMAELKKTRDRALSIRCVNNMKQLGLAVRVWANDNEDSFPPNIHSMSNELVTPKLLVCPSDPGRTPATGWDVYGAGDCSYEFLAPGPGKFGEEPMRIMWRCPFHGHVTLCDGSVQMGIALEHPEWLVWRDGVLHMDRGGSGAASPIGDVPGETSVTPGPQSVVPAGGAPGPGGVRALPVLRNGQVVGWDTNFVPVQEGPPMGMSPELMKRYGLMPADPQEVPAEVEFEVEVEAETEPAP